MPRDKIFLVLLLATCAIGASQIDSGSVTVEFAILDPTSAADTTTADTLANRLWKNFQNGDLEVGYDISFLNITYPNGTSFTGDSSDEDSSTASTIGSRSFPMLIISLFLSFFVFTEYTIDSRKQRLAVAVIVMVCSSSFITTASASILSSKYQNCMLLIDEVDYRLYWNVTQTNINFGIEVQSTGWVALGISADGNMNSGGLVPGSDIMMAFRNPSASGCENGCVHDYSTTVYNLPKLDTTQNVQLTSFLESNNMYYVEFTRPLNTSDTVADRVIDPMQSMYVIFSTQTDVKPINYTLFQKHNYQGSRSITFNTASACPQSENIKASMKLDIAPELFDINHFLDEMSNSLNTESDRFSVLNVVDEEPNLCPECQYTDMKIPDHEVSSETTTYTCVGFTFPTDQKYQAVRFEPIINNSQVLHHMVLYKSAIDYSSYGMFDCSSMPGSTYPMYAWGPGGGPFDVPINTGFPIGQGSSSYAVLQFHYNNPTNLAGLRDNSGFRIFYTNQTRATDAGFLWLGVGTGDITIPKGHANWHQGAECTQEAIYGALSSLGSPMTIFAYAMHMHYYGKQLWTEHYNNGAFVGYLGQELAYDFNNQHIVAVNYTLKIGDSLKSHCIWDTTNAPGPVYGGESTADEMCLQAILYYPLMEGVSGCQMNPTSGCDWGVNC